MEEGAGIRRFDQRRCIKGAITGITGFWIKAIVGWIEFPGEIGGLIGEVFNACVKVKITLTGRVGVGWNIRPGSQNTYLGLN